MRSLFSERSHENIVIIRCPILPAGKQNSNPLICQGSQGCVMRLSAFAQALIVALGPFAPDDRASREFVEGLSDEFRTGHTPMHPATLAASFRYRRYAGKHLYLGGRTPPL